MRLLRRIINLGFAGNHSKTSVDQHLLSTEVSPDRVEFVLIAEKGVLEWQALLLCESLRRFAGRYADSPVTVISPRPERRPTMANVGRLGALRVHYLELDIASLAPEYGATFKMYAAAEIERLSNAEFILFMDSDVLFADEPELDLHGRAVAVRPVDVKGMCTVGTSDPCDEYWQKLCTINDVNYDLLPVVETTVDKIKVKASYNGGFVLARRETGVFGLALAYFERSTAAGLAPWHAKNHRVRAGHGLVSAAGSQLWGSSQACLSLAIWGSGFSANILTLAHNFPLHTYKDLCTKERITRLRVVHYHHLFEENRNRNPLLNGKANVSTHFRTWLLEYCKANDWRTQSQ